MLGAFWEGLEGLGAFWEGLEVVGAFWEGLEVLGALWEGLEVSCLFKGSLFVLEVIAGLAVESGAFVARVLLFLEVIAGLAVDCLSGAFMARVLYVGCPRACWVPPSVTNRARTAAERARTRSSRACMQQQHAAEHALSRAQVQQITQACAHTACTCSRTCSHAQHACTRSTEPTQQSMHARE